MEGSNRSFNPRALLAMMLAMTAPSAVPMNDGRPNRQERRQARAYRREPRASRSKYTPHQGIRERKRRARQTFHLANPHTPYPAELQW